MRKTSNALLALATIGLLLAPIRVTAAAPDQAGLRPPRADIALSQDGMFRGRLVNAVGVAKVHRRVELHAAGQLVGKTTTDARGEFEISLDNGGVYTITDGQASVYARIWTAQAAPPSAKNSLLIVSDETITRGQDGSWFGLDLVGLAVIAGVTTAVIIAAIDDDDAS